MSNKFFPAIVDTVKQSPEIVAEGLDALVDAVLDSDVLSHVPVLSIAVKTLKIKDEFVFQRLKRNCKAFLEAVKDADHQKVEQMRIRLEEDPEQLKEVADTTMSVLMEGQKPIKSALVGRLIVALSENLISLEEFQTLSQMIQAGSVPALLALQWFVESNEGRALKDGFGIIKEEPLLTSLGIGSRYGNTFRISDLGQQLYRHGFGGSIQEV